MLIIVLIAQTYIYDTWINTPNFFQFLDTVLVGKQLSISVSEEVPLTSAR